MTITYNGSTAGSTASNPPSVLAMAMGGAIANSPGLTGAKVWFYTSTNTAADMYSSSAAIPDGYDLGMRTGDIVLGVTASAASTTPIGYFGVVSYAASGVGACLSANAVTSTAA